MSKRTIIILAVVIIALLGGGAYWYSSQQAAISGETLFPGESTTRGGEEGVVQEPSTEEATAFSPESGGTPPRLYQLHTLPVAGAGFFETKDKKGVITNTAIRYIEKGLGHIFETQLSTYTESRIVNETRSRLSEALWGNSGKSVVVRFVDNSENEIIKTRIINIDSSTNTTSDGFLKTEEIYLPDTIPFMAVSNDGIDSLFYLNREDGFTATFKNTAVTKIFNSAFTEWLPQFPNQKLITLTTRPSANIPGHMFFLDSKTSTVTKILNNINGLTTLTNSKGDFVLYSETIDNAPKLFLYDIAKKISIPLYLETLPEKCVWGRKDATLVYCAVPQALPRALYPDQWYQGLISFSDALWKINTTTQQTQKIFNPRELRAPSLDMTSLSISSDDSLLLFVDKISETPWLYSFIEPKPLTPANTNNAAQGTLGATTTAATQSTPTEASVPTSVVDQNMQKIK